MLDSLMVRTSTSCDAGGLRQLVGLGPGPLHGFGPGLRDEGAGVVEPERHAVHHHVVAAGAGRLVDQLAGPSEVAQLHGHEVAHLVAVDVGAVVVVDRADREARRLDVPLVDAAVR